MAKQKIALEIGLMNLIYGLLNELSVKLPENFMSQLRVHKDEICFTLVTDVPAKTIIQVLRKRLKWQFDQFKLTITINGKLYGSSYPNIGESIIEWPYWQATKTPLVYGLSIALAPLYVTILYFFICDRLPKKFDEQVKSASDSFLNICVLLSSLIVTFLITKAIAIRQEKSGRIDKVRVLSNKITSFRKVCDNLIGDWSFWPDNHFMSYGLSLKKAISYGEIADSEASIAYLDERFVNWVLKSKYGEIIPKLYLQLVAWSHDGEHYLYDTDHVYSLKELGQWTWFMENNLIWYVFENEKQDYENAFHFTNSYYGGNVCSAARVFDSVKYATVKYNQQLLLDISADVQHSVLPELYKIVSKNEEGLPFVFRYFLICFSIIISAGVVLKALSDILFNAPIADLISIQIVMAVLIHIFVCLPFIIRDEISLHPKYDYL